MADRILASLSTTFDAMHSSVGRPSIPSERLLKSSILMALYTVGSARMFCEQLDCNLLFRWFLDMSMDERINGIFPDGETDAYDRRRKEERRRRKQSSSSRSRAPRGDRPR
jgi:transposase